MAILFEQRLSSITLKILVECFVVYCGQYLEMQHYYYHYGSGAEVKKQLFGKLRFAGWLVRIANVYGF
jgi:hypothetical protein